MTVAVTKLLPRLRLTAALTGGKTVAAASRRLGHGGTALPGMVAEWLDPKLLSSVAAQLGRGSVVVTGTNGKTTTSRMLAAIGLASGYRVVHNRSGSNLMRGLTATAVDVADLRGRVDSPDGTMGVFEVDEATLPQALPLLKPTAVVFTNLFRDQLDRYGEVDSITSLWRRAVERLNPSSVLVLNADDPSVAELAQASSGRCLCYGVDDTSHATTAEHAADSRWCAACGSEYVYEPLYFGHIGRWRCPGCSRARPVPSVRATAIRLHPGAGSELEIETPEGEIGMSLALGGLYNAYNALAATAGAVALGVDLPAISRGLAQVDAAFGRQEHMLVRGRQVRLMLCKNPAGVNQVIRMLRAEPGEKYLLALLNDGTADGHDVSWIWDVDYEPLSGQVRLAVVSGRRAADLALRLKYAGFGSGLMLEPDERLAVDRAVAATPEGGTLTVLPTYTAMLSVRERLAELAGRGKFWED